MITRRLALVLCCLGLPAVAQGVHAQAKPEPMAMTPSQMRWSAQGGLAMAGMDDLVRHLALGNTANISMRRR